MKKEQLFALFAIGLPLTFAMNRKNPTLYSLGNGMEELFNADTSNTYTPSSGSIDSYANERKSDAYAPNLSVLRAQQYKINPSPKYRNLVNSDAIADNLAQRNAMTNIREGNIKLVPSNLVHKVAYTSLLMPTKADTQVVATNPLPSIIVNQPPSSTFTLSSGPDAVIRSEPILYKINASIIHQSDVINNVPKPLNLNPVYVKVFKASQSIDSAIEPVVHETYGHKQEPALPY